MSYYEWRPYVPVAERRRQAEKKVAKLKKKGQPIDPVKIEGRTIAKSFWGGAWCTNLECYSDYESRLPRGRTYVRNGSVVDLQIAMGEVAAMVAGSELYKIKVRIKPVAAAHWKAICQDCAGSVDSLVELLQGRLASGVMDRVCRKEDGLFPSPREITLSCSCPDWADMCKHVAAVLYGVGARLDEKPQLLFLLRGVDEKELIADAGSDLRLAKTAPAAARVLDDGDVAALFGLDMADSPSADPTAPAAARTPASGSKVPKGGTQPAAKTMAAATRGRSAPSGATTAEPKRTAAARGTKRRAQPG